MTKLDKRYASPMVIHLEADYQEDHFLHQKLCGRARFAVRLHQATSADNPDAEESDANQRLSSLPTNHIGQQVVKRKDCDRSIAGWCGVGRW